MPNVRLRAYLGSAQDVTAISTSKLTVTPVQSFSLIADDAIWGPAAARTATGNAAGQATMWVPGDPDTELIFKLETPATVVTLIDGIKAHADRHHDLV